MKCSESCPSGTLPSIASLYYLNKELFTEAELVAAFSAAAGSSSVAGANEEARAIGIKGEAVASQGSIPWTTIQGKAYFRDVLVRLECTPCRTGCTACFGK